MSETSDHQALFEFIQRMEPRYPALRFCHHSPNEANGGGRKVRTAYAKVSGAIGYRMVPLEALAHARMGTRAGYPDWVYPRFNQAPIDSVPRYGFGGLALELKCARSQAEAERKLSPEQRDWLNHFRSIGWYADVFWQWTDAARLLIQWEGGDPEEVGL